MDFKNSQRPEAALRDSDTLFRTIFENAAIGKAIAEGVPNGVFLRTNDRFCKMLGYGPGELVGRSFTELTHPDDRALNAENVRAILAGEIATYTMEKRYLRRDGSPLWVNITMALMRDEENRPTYFIASMLDISDLKRREQELSASEERFRLLVQTNAQIVFETDPAGELIGDLPTWSAFTGQKPEQWSLEGWADAVHPDDRSRAIAGWGAAVKAGITYHNEYRLKRADGAWRWGSVTATPVRGDDGQIVKWVGMIADVTERKLAEETLRQSEERLSFALKGARAGVWQWNIGTGDSIWSPETFALFEQDPQLAPPKFEVWLTGLHPDDVEPTRRAILGAIEQRAPKLRLQFRWMLRSGDMRWIEALMSLEFAADGTPLRMLGIDRDITESKLAEDTLRQSEERLRFALKGARARVWQWNIVTGESNWSPEMFDLYGREPELGAPLKKAGWQAHLHPDDRERVGRLFRDVLAKRSAEHRMEYRVVLPSGKIRWIEALTSVETAADGAPLRMFGINLDITERKRAEQQLFTSESRFRAAQEASLDGFLIYEPIRDERDMIRDFKVVYANPIAAKYCLSMPDRMEGQVIGDLVPDTRAPGGFIERMRRIVESGNSEEFILGFDSNGVAGSFRNLVVPFGRYAAVTVRDDTKSIQGANELGLAKAEAERANIAKSKFLAAASHDLRQPVQSIALLLGVIKRQAANLPKITSAVSMALASVKSLNGMLSGILDVSRLEAGVIEPVFAAVDLGDMVSRLAREYRPRAAADGLVLRCRPRDLRARTDAKLLERILRNLLENGLRYTARGGVLIGLRLRGDTVRLDVVDTGVGIPADKLAEVFEEFRQLNNPARDSALGLGLGLAIVARLAGLLGAEVQVRSRLGRGTRFSLLLPREHAALAAVAAIAPAVGHSGGRILVIEDNAAVRHAYEAMLADSGYQVVSAENGEEALALAGQQGWRFDAVLADNRLGAGLTGTATAIEISRQAGRAIPTLVVTGDTASERLAEVSASGFALLHKPVDPDELNRTLALLMSGAQLVTGKA